MEINIAGRLIGDSHPCFFIAEIGSNHNQNFDLAKRTIDAAADAGADAVKFQTFKAAYHYSTKVPQVSYLEGQDVFKLIESIELNREWQAPLMDYCERRGVVFLSSPCDPEAVQQLTDLGMAAHKIASFDLPDLDLVRLIARSDKPVILSTGMADWMDIQRAIDVCRHEGNSKLVLLQCTSLYPAPPELSNLASIQVMRKAFGTLTGYSDHTLGGHVSIASVALGACVVEKHFTLDRALPGPDHIFASEPAEFADMIRQVREVEAAVGDGVKAGPRPQEQEMFEKCRRSLHAAVPIESGQVIERDMLVSKRPGLGIPPHLINEIVGRRIRVDIEADAWLTWDYL